MIISKQSIRKGMGGLKNACLILVLSFQEKGMHSWYSYMCFQECLIEMLQEMFGEDSVPKIFKGEKLYVTVDGKKANIDLLNLVSPKLLYMLLSVCLYLLFNKTSLPVTGSLLWRWWSIPADCTDSCNQTVPVPCAASNRMKDNISIVIFWCVIFNKSITIYFICS